MTKMSAIVSTASLAASAKATAMTYTALKGETIRLLAACRITNNAVVDQALHEITKGTNLDSYRKAGELSHVSAAWIAAVDYRESDCNPKSAIGQGDRWDRKSIHVPRGFGPFKSKADASKFYLHYDHVDQPPPDGMWDLPYATFYGEKWNGFGPRMHGRHTGYCYAGTNIYNGGMYVSDGRWSAAAHDTRAGVVPIMIRLGQVYPDLILPPAPTAVLPPMPITPPQPPPDHYLNAAWLQNALNKLGYKPVLKVDNSFGWRTTRNLRHLQAAKHIPATGVFDEATQKLLEKLMAGK